MAQPLLSIFDFFRSILSTVATKLIVAVLILLIGVIIAKITERFILKILHEFELNKLLKKSRLRIAGEELIATIVKYFMYFVTVIIALNQIGLTTFVLNLVAGAFIVLILAMILLGIKDFIPNFIAGFGLYRKGFIKVGDKIAVNKLSGRITHMSLTETRIKTKSGDLINIPNSVLVMSVVKKKN